MADEITVTFSLKSAHADEAPIRIEPGIRKYTKAAIGRFATTNSIAITEESIATFGDLTTEGWCVIENLDTTYNVDIGFSTAVYGITLKPGEVNFFRMKAGLTLYLIAYTAPCVVDIQVLED